MRQDDHERALDPRYAQPATDAVPVRAIDDRASEGRSSSDGNGSGTGLGRTTQAGAETAARLAADCASTVTESTIRPGWMIETVISPFHCLYQDALGFHTQSRLARSDSEASRLARAALLLYVSSAEALVHQAADELGRPELSSMLVDPSRPIPLYEAWRLLPAIAGELGSQPVVRSRSAAVAAVRRAAGGPGFVGLPRNGPTASAFSVPVRHGATDSTNHWNRTSSHSDSRRTAPAA